MGKKPISRASNLKPGELDQLKKDLGYFFEEARKRLGYRTKDEFADAKNYVRSHYSEYESGKANPTLETIFNLLNDYGLKPEDLFKFQTQPEETEEKTQNSIPIGKIEQLREQVKSYFKPEETLRLTDQKASRIIKTLTFCLKPKSKAEILSNLGLKNTTNNFKRTIGLAIDLDWLRMTNPESPNDPKQHYLITEKGKRVI